LIRQYSTEVSNGGNQEVSRGSPRRPAEGGACRARSQRGGLRAPAPRPAAAHTALRIGTALGTGARLWLAMQQAYDLRKVEVELGDKVRAEVQSAA
jgi:hypothetical protein